MSGNDDYAIQVRGLTKRYGPVTAVDGVSFEVRAGEFFGFLGPNGAGKTTTIRVLTGVIRPDSGTVLIKGHRAGSIAAKEVTGAVPEMSNPYADLSGWGNLMFAADLYGVPSGLARARSEVLLQELGIYDRRDDPVKTYSKGMKQRLILCMSLVSDPEVLILDEPTSGLDVQSARLIKEMLRRLNAEGKTVFLTTHNMQEANQLCERVAVINKGRIVATDTPEKLRTATNARHSVEVSFDQAVRTETLARLLGVNAVQRAGDKYRLYAENPGELVVRLVNYACSEGLRIVSLNTVTPSLEDAFVALTEMEAGNV